MAVVREITKIHEEALRGTAHDLLEIMTGRRLKGELVLVLQGLGGRRQAKRRTNRRRLMGFVGIQTRGPLSGCGLWFWRWTGWA